MPVEVEDSKKQKNVERYVVFYVMLCLNFCEHMHVKEEGQEGTRKSKIRQFFPKNMRHLMRPRRCLIDNLILHDWRQRLFF